VFDKQGPQKIFCLDAFASVRQDTTAGELGSRDRFRQLRTSLAGIFSSPMRNRPTSLRARGRVSVRVFVVGY
jgi:hypothetical protein